MPVIITLPACLLVQSCNGTVAVSRRVLDANDDIEFDAAKVRFVDPFGLTLAGSSIRQVLHQGRAVRIRGLNPNVRGYLARMDLFKGVEFVDGSPTPGKRRNRADSLVELTHLEKPGEVGPASYRLAQALVGAMTMDAGEDAPDEMSGYRPSERLVEPIQYALNELLENALTHARMHGFQGACVSVAGQYYPKSDRVQLSVTDNGCGFLASLRGHHALLGETHQQAILLGLRPRVSRNRDLGLSDETVNEGVGLTTVVRIAEHAGGKAMILSGDFMHNTAAQTSGLLPEGVSWQGVAVVLEFRRDQLQNVRYRDLLPVIQSGHPTTLRFE